MNILIFSIYVFETAGNDTKILKSKPLIQMKSMNIRGNYSVELQNPVTLQLCLFQAVSDKQLSDMKPAAF